MCCCEQFEILHNSLGGDVIASDAGTILFLHRQ